MTVNEAAMRRRARIMRAVKVPMRAVLGLPFASPPVPAHPLRQELAFAC